MISAAKRTALSAASFLSAMTLLGTPSFAIDGGSVAGRIRRSSKPPPGVRLAGAGLSQEGVGVLKTAHLDPLLMTSTGLVIAKSRGSEVCRGDSGGPVVADGPGGPVLWGVASAVLTSR